MSLPERPGANIDLDTAVLWELVELTGNEEWLSADDRLDTVADLLDLLRETLGSRDTPPRGTP